MRSYRLAYTDSLLSAFRPRGAEARWNSEGTVMVYTSEHPALAALEMLHSWEVYTDLSGYHLYRCTFSEKLFREAPSNLDIHDTAATQSYGDSWIREQDNVMLKVRSVTAAESFNCLINPNHPDFLSRIELEPLGPFTFDKRIEQLLQSAKQSNRL